MRCFPVDWESRLYGPQKISAIVAVLNRDGVAAEQALEGTGLCDEMLCSTSTRISYRQIFAVIKNAIRLGKNPALAILAGKEMHATAYGMYGFGMLSSPTYEDEVQFILKYSEIIGAVAKISSCACEENNATYTLDVVLTPDAQDPIYRFALEFSCAAHLTIFRDLYGSNFKFSSLCLACPKPGHAELYEKYFDCPVKFNQGANQWRMDAIWVDSPRKMPDAVAHLMAVEYCQKFLSELSHVGGVASQVRRALLEKTPANFPTIDLMAEELGMQERTLRRRLEAEGTTYRELLAGARKLLAIDYLRANKLKTMDIATRLGYSDVANFRNAFFRWTGNTPRHYRKQK